MSKQIWNLTIGVSVFFPYSEPNLKDIILFGKTPTPSSSENIFTYSEISPLLPLLYFYWNAKIRRQIFRHGKSDVFMAIYISTMMSNLVCKDGNFLTTKWTGADLPCSLTKLAILGEHNLPWKTFNSPWSKICRQIGSGVLFLLVYDSQPKLEIWLLVWVFFLYWTQLKGFNFVWKDTNPKKFREYIHLFRNFTAVSSALFGEIQIQLKDLI